MAQIYIVIVSYGVAIPMRVTYTASPGRPATRWEPEEFPELECTEVVVTDNGKRVDVTMDLCEVEWRNIEEAVEEALSYREPDFDYEDGY